MDNTCFACRASLEVIMVINLLQEMADEPKAQDEPGKVGQKWRRTADKWSRPVRETREEDEHFLYATGKN